MGGSEEREREKETLIGSSRTAGSNPISISRAGEDVGGGLGGEGVVV